MSREEEIKLLKEKINFHYDELQIRQQNLINLEKKINELKEHGKPLSGYVLPKKIEVDPNSTLKMYILIRDSIDLGHAMLAVGHGVLACYLKFVNDEWMIKWLKSSFRKCVCKVNDKEFTKAKSFRDYVLMTESGLDGAETALVFCPRPNDQWDKPFTWYKLYR